METCEPQAISSVQQKAVALILNRSLANGWGGGNAHARDYSLTLLEPQSTSVGQDVLLLSQLRKCQRNEQESGEKTYGHRWPCADLRVLL